MKLKIALTILAAFAVSSVFLSGCVAPPAGPSDLQQAIQAQAPQGTGTGSGDITGSEMAGLDAELADLQDLLQETEEASLEGTGITDDFLK